MLKDMPAVPLTALRAPDGSFSTAPLAVDALASVAWDHIFNPTAGDPLSRITTYLDHVSGHLRTGSEFPLPPRDVDEFLLLLDSAPDRAAGLDAWAPRMWKHMERTRARWLLILFGLFDQGFPWPAELRQAKATFITKPSTSWQDRSPSGSS